MNSTIKNGLATITGLLLANTTMAQKTVKMKLADDMKPLKGAETSLVSLKAISGGPEKPAQVEAVYQTFDGNTITQTGSDSNGNGTFSMNEIKKTHVQNPDLGLDLTIKHGGAEQPSEQILKVYKDGLIMVSSETLEDEAVGKLMKAFQKSLKEKPPKNVNIRSSREPLKM